MLDQGNTIRTSATGILGANSNSKRRAAITRLRESAGYARAATGAEGRALRRLRHCGLEEGRGATAGLRGGEGDT